jgi:hypothetical protein
VTFHLPAENSVETGVVQHPITPNNAHYSVQELLSADPGVSWATVGPVYDVATSASCSYSESLQHSLSISVSGTFERSIDAELITDKYGTTIGATYTNSTTETYQVSSAAYAEVQWYGAQTWKVHNGTYDAYGDLGFIGVKNYTLSIPDTDNSGNTGHVQVSCATLKEYSQQ